MRQVSLALLAGMIGILNLSAAHAETVAERLSSATTVLEEIMTAPDKGIPQDLLDKAHCIVAVPGVKKAAFCRWRKVWPRLYLLPRRESPLELARWQRGLADRRIRNGCSPVSDE
jgi:hypothetical protein